MAKRSKELGSIKVDDKEMELIQGSLMKAGKALSEAESRSESNAKYMKSLDLQISEKAKGLARVVQIEEKVERMRGMISNMNKFKSALVETESTTQEQARQLDKRAHAGGVAADIPLRRLSGASGSTPARTITSSRRRRARAQTGPPPGST